MSAIKRYIISLRRAERAGRPALVELRGSFEEIWRRIFRIRFLIVDSSFNDCLGFDVQTDFSRDKKRKCLHKRGEDLKRGLYGSGVMGCSDDDLIEKI